MHLAVERKTAISRMVCQRFEFHRELFARQSKVVLCMASPMLDTGTLAGTKLAKGGRYVHQIFENGRTKL